MFARASEHERVCLKLQLPFPFQDGDIGTISLGILYLSFTLFSLVASPVVSILGSKSALLLGTSGYLLFIAANLKSSWSPSCFHTSQRTAATCS